MFLLKIIKFDLFRLSTFVANPYVRYDMDPMDHLALLLRREDYVEVINTTSMIINSIPKDEAGLLIRFVHFGSSDAETGRKRFGVRSSVRTSKNARLFRPNLSDENFSADEKFSADETFSADEHLSSDEKISSK